MTYYIATKKDQSSNTVVEELNAMVLTATFPKRSGEFRADLYSLDGGCINYLVFTGTCPPIHTTYERTVTIIL